MGASLAQGHAHIFLSVWFMVGLGKHQLYVKFEVASFSHRTNIQEEPPNFGEIP